MNEMNGMELDRDRRNLGSLECGSTGAKSKPFYSLGFAANSGYA